MPVGRPPKYKTPEDMQEVIDEYFDSVRGRDDTGRVTSFRPTVSGIALALGMSTEAFRNYQDKDEFLATVKRAKQHVEVALEAALYGTGVAGVIFNLKNNFGMVDKQEVEQTNKIEFVDHDPSIYE